MLPPELADYRACVGIALFNHEGDVFIGRRRGLAADEKYAWQMPQGGIDEGETPREAAARELREETNVASAEFLAEAPRWLAYDLPKPMLRKSWRNRYRGQAQKWIAFRFVGDEGEINIETPDGGEKPEFSHWRWEKLEATVDLVVPFKRAVYRDVAKLFKRHTRGDLS
ncbi:RNA pyrophosphohydrolase [Terrarubrum flagellatum]|uniref:RNA pyrophosphohydrolase n=1 Tax=Terrirubrum flagellatum TaxID=2895980 RepID=UPI0031455A42